MIAGNFPETVYRYSNYCIGFDVVSTSCTSMINAVSGGYPGKKIKTL